MVFASKTRDRLRLPSWVVIWFYLTAVICTYDASFIMLRPYSMPGGCLAWIWFIYKYYIAVDQRYQDEEDAFVFAQSLLNYVEVLINVLTLVMNYRQSRSTYKMAFMVSVMTFWKTVLYFLMFSDFCSGGKYRHGNTTAEEIFLVLLPNIVWIFAPLGVMVQLWDKLLPGGQDSEMTSEGHVTCGNGVDDDEYSNRTSKAQELTGIPANCSSTMDSKSNKKKI